MRPSGIACVRSPRRSRGARSHVVAALASAGAARVAVGRGWLGRILGCVYFLLPLLNGGSSLSCFGKMCRSRHKQLKSPAMQCGQFASQRPTRQPSAHDQMLLPGPRPEREEVSHTHAAITRAAVSRPAPRAAARSTPVAPPARRDRPTAPACAAAAPPSPTDPQARAARLCRKQARYGRPARPKRLAEAGRRLGQPGAASGANDACSAP